MSQKRTYKAAVLKAFHQPFVIEEKPVPDPGPGEVLVRVKASGLCLTDCHIWDGMIPTVRLPYTPGHEMAGIIEAVGEGVDPARVGEHICTWIDKVCGKCKLCRTGRENLCLHRERIGFECDGSHEEYCVIPSVNALRIAENIPFQEAAVIPDAILTMYHAIKTAGRAQGGDTVLLAGIGALGLQGVQIAHMLGCKVIASGRTPSKLAVAEEFGADYVINTREQDLYEEIMKITDGELCDSTYDLIGMEDSTLTLQKCTRPGGKIIEVAYSVPEFKVNYMDCVVKGKEIIGIRSGTLAELRECIRLVEERKLKPFVPNLWKLEDINDAIHSLRTYKNVGRSAIVFDD